MDGRVNMIGWLMNGDGEEIENTNDEWQIISESWTWLLIYR